MTQEAWLVIIGAVLNAATTWGILSTQMKWMRADIERHEKRLDAIEARAVHA